MDDFLGKPTSCKRVSFAQQWAVATDKKKDKLTEAWSSPSCTDIITAKSSPKKKQSDFPQADAKI